jgi:hypothetical protein
MSDYNNPANIETGQGYAGETGETYANDRPRPFVVFDSPQMGVRALARDLKTKAKRWDGDVYKMLAQFAPDFENPTHNYTKHVVKNLGGRTKIDVNNEDHVKLMMKGIIEFENGINSDLTKKYMSPEVFDEGYNLSNQSFPSNTTLESAREYMNRKNDLLSRL